MSQAVFSPASIPSRRPPRWVRDLLIGGLHWLVFLLLLEPGNMLAAHDGGWKLDLGRELVRIAGATLLGVAATPPLFWLVRHRPVRGRDAWRNGALHALGAGGIAAVMIAVSCPLAAWIIGGPAALGEAIADELRANWAPVVYGIGAFLAAAHAFRFLRDAEPAREPAFLSRITVTAGRRTRVLDLAEVDWIETQGNYVALHAGGAAYLVRSTLRDLEARLDPTRFARIHRRRIVALDRIVEATTLEGGDADLRLRDGSVLRLSRSFRRAVRERLWSAAPSGKGG